MCFFVDDAAAVKAAKLREAVRDLLPQEILAREDGRLLVRFGIWWRMVDHMPGTDLIFTDEITRAPKTLTDDQTRAPKTLAA